VKPKVMKVTAALLLLTTAGVGAVVVWLRSHGFSARAEPSRVEAKLARLARRVAMPAGAGEVRSPGALTREWLTEAREHFVKHCSACHGVAGRGDTPVGRNLYPRVPDLADADTQQLIDGELFYIISNGVRFRGMPAWGGEDSPESIWGLVAFIQRLPKLSPEEVKLMQETADGAGDHATGEAGEPRMKEMPGMEGMKDEGKTQGKGNGAGQGGRKSVKPHPH
jgi:mono/diheme cytochrome c family protein